MSVSSISTYRHRILHICYSRGKLCKMKFWWKGKRVDKVTRSLPSCYWCFLPFLAIAQYCSMELSWKGIHIRNKTDLTGYTENSLKQKAKQSGNYKPEKNEINISYKPEANQGMFWDTLHSEIFRRWKKFSSLSIFKTGMNWKSWFKL